MDDLTREAAASNGDNEFDTGGEEEYDAFNDETFGDTNLNTDWEENHEMLSGLEEQSRTNFDDENGELSKRVASFILDDENDDIQVLSITPSLKQLGDDKQTEDSTNWWKGVKNKKISWSDEKPELKAEVKPIGSNIKKVLCVQDLERSILMQSSTSSQNQNQRQGKLVLQRVEDVERELKNNALALNMPGQKVPNQIPPQPGGFNLSFPPPPLPQMRPPLQPPINPPLHVWMNQGGPPRQCLFAHYHRHQGVTQVADFQYFNTIPCMSMIGGPMDPYAGLMTPQEKQWLASIQVMQLSNASQAFHDDYYYLMYSSRQLGICGRKLGNSMLKSNQEVTTNTKKTYKPQQFENSLGKLQIGSVTAPRKIIDIDYHALEKIPVRVPCRTRKILLEIEWMYDVALKIEEMNYFRGSPSDSEDPLELANNCINRILKDNKLFLNIMEVRKGRNVVLRLTTHLRNPGPLIEQLISNMIPITKKDSDQTLLRFLPAIRTWLSSVNLDTMVELCEKFGESFEFILSHKLTVSILTNMIERAEKIISSSSLLYNVSSLSSPSVCSSLSSPTVNDVSTEKWLRIIEKVAKTASSAKHIERPVVGINARIFSNHLARIQTTNGEQFVKLQVAISTTRTSDISV